MNGIITLRSYRKFDHFKIRIIEAIEKSANSTFCFVSATAWIGIRLELLCNMFSIATAIICFVMKNQFEDKEQLTFSLQIILDIVYMFSVAVRMGAETQQMMTSSQRVYNYTKLEQEDLLEKTSDK